MTGMTRRRWLGAVALGGLGGLVAQARGEPSRWSDTSPRDAIRERYFPDVVLTTHDGAKVRFYTDLIKDRIVVINFMYTRCTEGTCPLTTFNLVQVQKLLGDRVGRDIFFNSITLTPEHDSPEVLKDFADGFGVGPGWSFLTGAPADIELLRRRLGFTDPDPDRDADTSNHIGMLRYGNEPLQLWAGCPGNARPEWIARSLSWVDTPHPSVEEKRQ